MKKFLVSVILLTLLATGGYFLYRAVMSEIVAAAMVSESMPAYIPRRLQTRVESMRKPLNKGTEALLQKMHEADIPLGQVLKAVDNVSEQDVYAFLDELNSSKPDNSDEVFDLAKKHFPTDFDAEVFREPFIRHFDIRQIRKGIQYANRNRKYNDVDMATAKAIVKQVIIQKNEEMSRSFE